MASRAKLAFALVVGRVPWSPLGSAHAARRSKFGAGAIIVPPPTILKQWNADTDNLIPIQGTVEWNGKPVSGVSVRVDTYLEPQPTDAQGHFTYLVDGTLMGRHVVTIATQARPRSAAARR